MKELKAYLKERPEAIASLLNNEENKDFVLDVVMKREYAKGTIINLECGLGSDHRWKARGFASKYNDFHRLSAFGNVNNVNEDCTPGTDGDWSPKKQNKGLLTTRQMGLNYNFTNSENNFSISNSTTFECTDADTKSRSLNEKYSPSGSIFAGAVQSYLKKNFKIDSKTRFWNRQGGGSILSGYFNITYNNIDRYSEVNDSTYTEALTNRYINYSQGKEKGLSSNGSLMWGKAFDGKCSLHLIANYNYYHSPNNKQHTLREIEYLSTRAVDNLHDYDKSHYNRYLYNIDVSNEFRLSKTSIVGLSAKYVQVGYGSGTSYYRLASLGDNYENSTLLPSTSDSLALAMDYGNSYDYYNHKRTYSLAARYSYDWKNLRVSLNLTYNYNREKINYWNNYIDTEAKRSYGQWAPYFSLSYKYRSNNFRMSYLIMNNRPVFESIMPRYNNQNPLYVTINNPSLKSRLLHKLNVRLDMQPKRGPKWWVDWEWSATHNNIGNRRSYNTKTGGTTSMADNVNGNWETKLSYGLNGSVDKKRHLSYDLSGGLKFLHCVDFAFVYDENGEELSRVNTINPRLTLKFNYRLAALSTGIKAKLEGNYIRENERLSVHDNEYGAWVSYTIPLLKLNIATDISLFTRHGYGESFMNTKDWVWNATFSRSFFNGHLTAKVDCFDILHELTNKAYKVNAQGHTETWYNTIPRYFMFSLTYNFTKKPKKN